MAITQQEANSRGYTMVEEDGGGDVSLRTTIVGGSVETTPSAIPAGEAHIGEVGGRIVQVTKEFTRPANTTGYVAGDVVSNDETTTVVQELDNCARVNGGTGYVTGVRLVTDKKSITPRIRVHLFNVSTPTVSGDNVAHKELYADESKRVGHIDLPAMTTPTDTTNSTMSQSFDYEMRLPFLCVTRDLFFILETLDAFTPASGQKFSLTLLIDQN